MNKQRMFFIADTHFGSDAVRRYENRPFDSVSEMDKAMIERWNSVVAANDIVWHLGDFGEVGCEKQVIAQLNGSILFVKGNPTTITGRQASARYTTIPSFYKASGCCHTTRNM